MCAAPSVRAEAGDEFSGQSKPSASTFSFFELPSTLSYTLIPSSRAGLEGKKVLGSREAKEAYGEVESSNLWIDPESPSC